MPEDDVPDWLSDRASGVFVQARPGFDGDEYYVATEAGRDVVVATMDVFSRNHRGLRAVRKGVCLMWEARSDDGDMLRKSMPAHRELSDALPNITLTDLAVRSGVVDMMRSYLQDPGCAPVHRLAFTSA